MHLRGRRALATASTLVLALAAGACSAEVDQDGADVEIDDDVQDEIEDGIGDDS